MSDLDNGKTLKILNSLGLGAAFFALLGLFGWFLKNHLTLEQAGWQTVATEIHNATVEQHTMALEVQKSNLILSEHIGRNGR